jgi:hypothetical protein
MLRPGIVQPHRNPVPLDAVHPLKMLGNQARLVALDRADEVPLQWKVLELEDLPDPFLRLVFAERVLAAGVGLGHVFDRPRLAHRNELDLLRLPSREPRGALDPRSDGLQVGAN